jgi:hypothetical protein
VTTFASYVQRSIVISNEVGDSNKITTGVVIEDDGSILHVPTIVERVNGKYYAHINSLTDDVYTVIWNEASYDDTVGHWARASIHNMGSRLIVNGVGDGLFAPNRNITRAEFATIVVRALGIKSQKYDGRFTDVNQSSWYSNYVQTAYGYGLITGFSDGTFRANETITRQQAMLIISKAMVLTGLSGVGNATDRASIINAYADGNQVASWAFSGVADVISAGIFTGRSANSLVPEAPITRAEVAVIIERLLKYSDLINH